MGMTALTMICVSRIAKKTAEVLSVSRWEQRCVFFLFLLAWPFSLPIILGKKTNSSSYYYVFVYVEQDRELFLKFGSPPPTTHPKNNQNSNKQKKQEQARCCLGEQVTAEHFKRRMGECVISLMLI